MTTRIAMWSGPRNISTAMMRSFSARGDCDVVDEPLYAHYLRATGLDHPGREEVLATQPDDAEAVAAVLNGPCSKPLRYVKHMAHHLTADAPDTLIQGWRHAFLIRDPGAMLISLDKVLPFEPRLIDTGLPQQAALLERVQGPVVDADALLADPAAELSALCRHLGIEPSESMLSWPAGPHPSDGVWAHHWYDAVTASTSFGPPREPVTSVPPHLEAVFVEASTLYTQIRAASQE